MAQAIEVSVGVDPASMRAFQATLRRYIVVTGKTAEEACKRQIKNVLIKARTAMESTPRNMIPDFADGSVAHCKIVAWRMMARTGRVRAKTKAGQWRAWRWRTINYGTARQQRRRADTDLLRRSNRAYSREAARAMARKMTRQRRSHARFGQHLFTDALNAVRVAGGRNGGVARAAYVHVYKTPLTNALQPRVDSARAWQPTIDRAISIGLRRAARDMADYIARKPQKRL